MTLGWEPPGNEERLRGRIYGNLSWLTISEGPGWLSYKQLGVPWKLTSKCQSSLDFGYMMNDDSQKDSQNLNPRPCPLRETEWVRFWDQSRLANDQKSSQRFWFKRRQGEKTKRNTWAQIWKTSLLRLPKRLRKKGLLYMESNRRLAMEPRERTKYSSRERSPEYGIQSAFAMEPRERTKHPPRERSPEYGI